MLLFSCKLKCPGLRSKAVQTPCSERCTHIFKEHYVTLYKIALTGYTITATAYVVAVTVVIVLTLQAGI
jgi:hypothetical protein